MPHTLQYYAGILTLSLLVPGIGYPCSCEPPPPPLVALRQSSAVFAGTVVSVEEWFSERDGSMFNVTFRVAERWDGATEMKATVVTATDEARCGFEFEVGGDYLVYAFDPWFQGAEFPQTGICTRTRPLSEAAGDLAVLRLPTVIERVPWAKMKLGGCSRCSQATD
jgi:hypothetical protein